MKKTISILLTVLVLCTVFAAPVSALSHTVTRGEIKEFGSSDGHIIYYPLELEENEEKWPVIVWANGTLCAPVLYTDLLRDFAKNGYVVVASSEMMSADGKDQCHSLDNILALNGDPASQFYGKIDGSRVAAVGHSQGGRSSVNAAKLDERIKCVISLAGSNTKEERNGLKTPAFFITGTLDAIVASSLWVKPMYQAANGPAVYASLKGAVHTTYMLQPERVMDYSLKWLDAVLNHTKASYDAFVKGGELSKDPKWTNFDSKNLDSLNVGSMLSGGSLWIVIAVAAAAVCAVIVLISVKKKKPVPADGEAMEDEEE